MNEKRKQSQSAARTAVVDRETRETTIHVELNVDGVGEASLDTGIPFMDHMLELFAKHGFFDLNVKAKGDLDVDYHHTMEDLGITLGSALAKAVGDKTGIRRYGWCALPMDEAQVLISLDLSGRPYLVYDLKPPSALVKDIETNVFHEFFQAFTVNAAMNLHVKLLSGDDAHHAFEAVFKGLAKALDQATGFDPRMKGVPSTKGIL